MQNYRTIDSAHKQLERQRVCIHYRWPRHHAVSSVRDSIQQVGLPPHLQCARIRTDTSVEQQPITDVSRKHEVNACNDTRLARYRHYAPYGPLLHISQPLTFSALFCYASTRPPATDDRVDAESRYRHCPPIYSTTRPCEGRRNTGCNY